MNMSKLLKWSLSTVLAASLTACGSSDSGSSTKDNTGTGVSEGLSTSGDSTTDVNSSDSTTSVTTEVVVDIIKPEILLNGGTSAVVHKGQPYQEQGAIVVDNVDKDLEAVVVGVVDSDKLGTYTITYNATDKAGNKADTVTRKVFVVDGSKPIITLSGQSPVIIAHGGAYIEPGFNAYDNRDGNLTSSVVVVSNVDTNTLGEYEVRYTVEDSVGNKETMTRKIVVKDKTKPVITLNRFGANDKIIYLVKGNSYNDPGVTLSDNIDSVGNISLVTTGVEKIDTSKVGTYNIIYTATDKSGNVSSLTRQVIVMEIPDAKIPTIVLKGENPIVIQAGTQFVDPGVDAADDRDIDLKVRITGEVDSTKVGIYTLTYTVIDSAGNKASVTREVNVVDGAGNTIALNGDNPMIVAHGSEFIDAGYSTTDVNGKDMSVTVEDDIDTSKVGEYSLTYSATDSSGNALSATRAVKVTDQTKPVISLSGTNPTNIRRGEIFNDLGAVVTDNWDNNLEVSVSGDVNTATIGKYTLTYSIADSAGNQADSVTRDVFVLDEQAPTITLYGDNPMVVAYQGEYQEFGAMAQDNKDENIDIDSTDSSKVDTSKVGEYDVIYKAVDSVGNIAETVRIVTVKDLEAPTLELLGDKTVTITLGNSYVEPGYTARDNLDIDSDINNRVQDVSNINIDKAGAYKVDYSVTDKAGNTTTAIRRVIVVNPWTGENGVSRPTINVNGNYYVNIPYGEVYNELATATDSFGVELDVTTSRSVDTSKVACIYLDYKAVDSYGNVAFNRYARRVCVYDDIDPVITMAGDNPLYVEVNSTLNDPGATATDNVDGTMVNVLATSRVNTNKVGTYSIIYSAKDSSENFAQSKTREVYVVLAADANAPIITLNGDAVITMDEDTSYKELGATAVDDRDGALSVKIAGYLNSDKPGTYTKEYHAVDLAGHSATKYRSIIVKDLTPPDIKLRGEPTVVVFKGNSYSEKGAYANDNSWSSWRTKNVYTRDKVDTSTVGTYILKYNTSDNAGNKATITRTVVVQDPTK